MGFTTTTDVEDVCPECGHQLVLVEQDVIWLSEPDLPVEYYYCAPRRGGCGAHWDLWLEERLD